MLASSVLVHLAVVAGLWVGVERVPFAVDEPPIGVLFYRPPAAVPPAPKSAGERRAERDLQATLDRLVQPTAIPDSVPGVGAAGTPDAEFTIRPAPNVSPWAADPATAARAPGQPDASLPADAGGEVSRPELIESTRQLPDYPVDAQADGIEGVVVLRATIDEHGRPQDLRVLRGLSPTLDRAALAAVRHWRFRPATRQGIPVKVFYILSVNFRLQT